METQKLPVWQDDAALPLETRPLGILTAHLESEALCFDGPYGGRKIVMVTGGSLIGPLIRARILPGGGDWALLRGDGILLLDVRLVLQTDDGAVVYMTYTGRRHAPETVMARLARGEAVAPTEMYFRIAPVFETGDARYGWMNKLIAVGVGERLKTGPRYHIHEIL